MSRVPLSVPASQLHSTLWAAWLRPKQTDFVPDKGQFRSRVLSWTKRSTTLLRGCLDSVVACTRTIENRPGRRVRGDTCSSAETTAVCADQAPARTDTATCLAVRPHPARPQRTLLLAGD